MRLLSRTRRKSIYCGVSGLLVIFAAPHFLALLELHAQTGGSQEPPNAFPREGARKLLENAWGTGWDVTWAPGSATPMHRHAFDYVGVELADATFTVVAPDGQRRTIVQKRGSSYFLPRGTTHIEEASDRDPPRHAVIIELKDAAAPSLRDTTTSKSAFPEDAAKRLVENRRVAMWDFEWPTDASPAAYFYEHDAFIVFTEGGELTSSVDGSPARVVHISAGQLVFRTGGHAFSERSTRGGVRGIVVELK